MTINDDRLLEAMRSRAGREDVCRAAGVSAAEFDAARDDWLRRHAPKLEGRFSGRVSGAVELKRDAAGVPHIHGGTLEDLHFGLGVATAQDRLWQIDRLRRRALGEQAEILGEGYVASDVAHRTVGIDLIATREVEAMDDTARGVAEAYVAGINRAIEVMGADLPVEFRLLEYAPAPFTVRDVVAIGRGIWWSLNGRIDRLAAAESARFLPEALRTLYLTPEAAENLVVPSDCLDRSGAAGTDDATGSNNWALRPERTESGEAILCGDPHQPFWVPSSWYEYALHGPNGNAAGAGHPGFPGMWWGCNGAIAWAITNNMASTRDLYREEVKPDDASRYREGGAWRRFEERAVAIRVRGGTERALTIRSTVRGPVVNGLLTPVTEGGDPPLSMRWVGAEHLDDLRASIGLSGATSWGAFRRVLLDWAVAVFNFAYADRHGNIGYQMSGRLPIRGRITHGFRDAGNPEDQWKGYIPFDELPRSFNPSRGYVASANQRIVSPDFAFPIYGAYSQGHRGVRLDQALGATGRLDHAANVGVQNDVKNCRAERLCEPLCRMLRDNTDADVRLLVRTLEGWDHRYALENAAPTVFESFMARWTRRVLARHLPLRLLDLTVQQTGLASSLIDGAVPDYFPAGIAAEAAVVARETVAHLRERLGQAPADWAWGRVHLAHWKHPLSSPALDSAFDIGPMPVDGGSHTLRNTGGELPPHMASSGAEYRIVADFSAPDRFLAVQNIGNSGVPGSPHYRDQFQPWIDGTYHEVRLTPDAAASTAVTHIDPTASIDFHRKSIPRDLL